MNNKLLLQDLTDQLAEAGKIKKKEAEEFLRAFFKISEDALFEDGIVKINGLGTLKLILVDARKSVNVSTGEEFEISAHYKVSLLPDADLKSLVNQPYAHLEPVELDGGAEPIAHTPLEKKTAMAKDKATKIPVEKVKPTRPEKTALPKEPRKFKRSTLAWMLFFLLIIILGVWSWISNNQRRKDNALKMNEIELIDSLVADATLQQDLAALEKENGTDSTMTRSADDSLESVVESVATEEGIAQPVGNEATQKSVVTKSTTPAAKKVESANRTITQPAKPIATSSNKTTSSVKPVSPAVKVDYLATVVMKPGDRLNLLALKYYGEKVFWVYIYQANKSVIPNPDHVPTGTTIHIPKVDPKLIDPKNEALVAKAKAFQLQYIGAE